jgi:hypothetical protein
MIRITAFLAAICIGCSAMAVERDRRPYDPLKQRVTPHGKVQDQDAPPTREEMMEWMWRRFAGEEMPDDIRREFNVWPNGEPRTVRSRDPRVQPTQPMPPPQPLE